MLAPRRAAAQSGSRLTTISPDADDARSDVMMPPIGVLIGGSDFSSLAGNIGNPVADAKGVVTGVAIIK